MTDWCGNILRVSGPRKKVRELTWAVSLPNEVGAVNPASQKPMPLTIFGSVDLLGMAGSLRLASVVPQDPGDGGWYQFRMRHWGPKWEIEDEAVEWTSIRLDDEIAAEARGILEVWGAQDPGDTLDPAEAHSVVTYTFDSANAPVSAWARTLASLFPGVVVSLRSDAPHCGEVGHELFCRTGESPDVVNRFTLTPEDMPVSEEDIGEPVEEDASFPDPVAAAMRRVAVDMLDERLLLTMKAMSLAACVVERSRSIGAGEVLIRSVRERGLPALDALDDEAFDALLTSPPRTASGYGVVDALMACRAEELLGEDPGLDELGRDPMGVLGSMLSSLGVEQRSGGSRLARLLGSDAGILVGGQHVAAFLGCTAKTEADRLAFLHLATHCSMTPLANPPGDLMYAGSDDSPQSLVDTILSIVRDAREGRPASVRAPGAEAETRRLRSLLVMACASGTAATESWDLAERLGLPRAVVARGALTSALRLRRYAQARGVADLERELEALSGLHQLSSDCQQELDLARNAELMRTTIAKVTQQPQAAEALVHTPVRRARPRV